MELQELVKSFKQNLKKFKSLVKNDIIKGREQAGVLLNIIDDLEKHPDFDKKMGTDILKSKASLKLYLDNTSAIMEYKKKWNIKK